MAASYLQSLQKGRPLAVLEYPYADLPLQREINLNTLVREGRITAEERGRAGASCTYHSVAMA